jgi:hypothetical protein
MTNEIDRLADFLLRTYPDRIGAGDFQHGESAVDVAIRLLTPQGCGHPAVCIRVGEKKAPGEFVQICGWCEAQAEGTYRDRRMARMAETLEGVQMKVTPYLRMLPRVPGDVDAALERVDVMMMLLRRDDED